MVEAVVNEAVEVVVNEAVEAMEPMDSREK